VRNTRLGGAKLSTVLDDLDESNTFLCFILFSEEFQLRFDSGKVQKTEAIVYLGRCLYWMHAKRIF